MMRRREANATVASSSNFCGCAEECWLGGKADESGTKRAKIELDFANLQLLQRESAAFSVEAPSFGFSVGTSCNNYLKCCKWNGDGRLLVTSSQDRHVRLFELNEAENQVTLIRSIPLGDLIYEVCWHPSKDWLVTSSKDHPIHIWDRDGSRVLSFRGINHLVSAHLLNGTRQDELSSAYSLCFSLDGRYLYGGYKKVIRVFDMASCGRQIREIPTWKKKIGGQKGIISCVAMNPAVNGVYAAGCYGKQLAVYSDLTASAVCIFDTPSSATTHIRYSPDGNRLFVAARKDDIITCWDLRFVGQVLGYLRRPSSTNQRIYFEMDSLGRYLLSGSTCGDVHVFSLSELKDEPTDASSVIRAHRSAVVGVSLHPSGAILATCSGQRIFPMPSVDADLSEDENCYEALSLPDQLDNSLCLWGAHGKRVL
ncbi:unnamed protein product [Toxocara canis]|uniref:WD repeat-containing protein 79 n=1 Tax=Toxocara canis TaxID=6265 RepID=A0A183UL59_TOXCA|nr:unnamed protein product [Toxocara canis]